MNKYKSVNTIFFETRGYFEITELDISRVDNVHFFLCAPERVTSAHVK